jgi:hypothetical protein
MKTHRAFFPLLLILASSCGDSPTQLGSEERPGDPIPSECNNTVAVAWDASVSSGVNYTVHVGPRTREYSWQFDVPPGELTQRIGQMGRGSYYLAVTAYSGPNRSDYSNEVKIEFENCNTTLQLRGN